VKLFRTFSLILIFAFNTNSAVDSLNYAVRGVWLTNVDSKALNSKENIVKTVKTCSELGINTIFVVTWNKAMTTYPSKIMKDFTGVEIDTAFKGRDPLKELIEESHKMNIKVLAWFEFGFSSSYKQNGGKILKLKPQWAAIDNKQKLVSKNGFEWMNGINPEVQNFLLSLVLEVVRNYDIDGIQGDDRLPAMPVEGGYDPYTVSLYQSEHKGKLPPANFRDSSWIDWRANKLNLFMEKIYKSVKEINPNVIVSMAPSIYPWSKNEYLQDWVSWVKKGLVDLVIPQVYRYSLKEYSKSLEEIIKEQIPKDKFSSFYPGVLLKVGKYYPTKKYLREMIAENRKHNINGEVFFFYEGVKKFQSLFKEFYKTNSAFPQIIGP
jgi:uncharacterized lipoprotein YddW (UPF0748 family)